MTSNFSFDISFFEECWGEIIKKGNLQISGEGKFPPLPVRSPLDRQFRGKAIGINERLVRKPRNFSEVNEDLALKQLVNRKAR